MSVLSGLTAHCLAVTQFSSALRLNISRTRFVFDEDMFLPSGSNKDFPYMANPHLIAIWERKFGGPPESTEVSSRRK